VRESDWDKKPVKHQGPACTTRIVLERHNTGRATMGITKERAEMGEESSFSIHKKGEDRKEAVVGQWRPLHHREGVDCNS
jgi:hypothetical protein